MKRIFLIVFALFVTACSVNQPPLIPTATVKPLVPTKIPTSTPTPEVVIDARQNEDSYSDQLVLDIKAGMYETQILGLEEWAKYWAANGMINTESPLQAVFLEDQNHQGLAAFAIDKQYWFPPLNDGELIYDGAPPIGTKASKNLDPLKVNKVIDINDPEFKKQGYSAEMEVVLGSSVFALKGQQMVTEKDGKIVAYLDRKTGRWEKEKDWAIIRKRAEASGCPLIMENLTSGDFIDYAARHDDMPISSNVIVSDIIINSQLPGPFSIPITWNEWPFPDPIPNDGYKLDPSTKPNTRIAFGILNDDGYNWVIKVVRYVQKDGSIGYLQFKGPSDGQAYGIAVNMIGDWTIYEWLGDMAGYNDPKVQKLLKEWVDKQKIPGALRYVLLREEVNSGR